MTKCHFLRFQRGVFRVSGLCIIPAMCFSYVFFMPQTDGLQNSAKIDEKHTIFSV